MSKNGGGENCKKQLPTAMAGSKPAFRLYVSGAKLTSTLAIVSVKRALESMCGRDYELRAIDIYQNGKRLTVLTFLPCRCWFVNNRVSFSG